MDAIIAFSFGRIGHEPNQSSIAIAELVAKKATPRSQFIIIAQWEVAIALESLGVSPDHIVQKNEKGYLKSSDVANSAAMFLATKKYPLGSIFAVGHPDHVRRCVLVLRNVGILAQRLSCNQIGYDPCSTEKWVRSRRLFLFRELLATPFYLFSGELF